MKRFLALFALAIALSACAPQLPPDAEIAKPFNNRGFEDNGKELGHYSLLDLLKTEPVVILFLHHECPVCIENAELFDELAESLSGKAHVIAVLNATERQTEIWARDHSLSIPVLVDPPHMIVDDFGVTQAPSAVLVNRNRAVVARWVGAGAEANEAIVAAVSKLEPESTTTDIATELAGLAVGLKF